MHVYGVGIQDMGHSLVNLGLLRDMSVQRDGYGGYLHA